MGVQFLKHVSSLSKCVAFVCILIFTSQIYVINSQFLCVIPPVFLITFMDML